MSPDAQHYVMPEAYVASPERFFREWLPAAVAAFPEARRRYGDTTAVAQVELTGEEGGVWHVELGGGQVVAREGPHAAPSFTLRLGVGLWRRLLRGEANGLQAFVTGEVTLRGSWLTFLKVARKFR